MAGCIIVVPCYNEAKRLDLQAFIEHTARHDHHFLFVNDGSHDATAAVLDDLTEANPEHMSVLHLPINVGKAEAVRQGVLEAFSRDAELIGYFDADLATPLDAIVDLEQYLRVHPNVDFLMGARVRLLGRFIDRKPVRHFVGRTFATLAAVLLQLPVYDTQCGAKLFRGNNSLKRIFTQRFFTKWLFDVELLARLLIDNESHSEGSHAAPESRIHELPLAVWRDVDGSKLKPRDFLQAIWQLFQIRAKYRLGSRTPRPPHHASETQQEFFPVVPLKTKSRRWAKRVEEASA